VLTGSWPSVPKGDLLRNRAQGEPRKRPKRSPSPFFAIPAQSLDHAAVSLLVALFAYSWMLEVARSFSTLLEAAFDLHRIVLYQSLHWSLPINSDEERAMGQRLTEYLWRGPVRGPFTFTYPEKEVSPGQSHLNFRTFSSQHSTRLRCLTHQYTPCSISLPPGLNDLEPGGSGSCVRQRKKCQKGV
jgi:hypothetical protein